MSHSDDRRQGGPTPSVVVPNLNGARYIEQTLDSLAAQQAADLEVVVVDGGSTDGSLEIIDRWAARHGARWISEPDEGQAQAINKGFRMATGEIVTWINSDDLLHRNAVARVVAEFAADPELEFLWGFCLEIDARGNPIRVLNPLVRTDLAALRRTRNFVPQPASWYRRTVIEKFGPLDESYQFAFDYEFFLRIAGRVDAAFLPEILAQFRVHESSKTVSQTSAFAPEAWRAFRSHGGRLRSAYALDTARDLWLAPLWRTLSSPLRSLVRRAFGVRPGERVRP
jgi:glycosyltransferase involved in cell wall biosynthesis